MFKPALPLAFLSLVACGGPVERRVVPVTSSSSSSAASSGAGAGGANQGGSAPDGGAGGAGAGGDVGAGAGGAGGAGGGVGGGSGGSGSCLSCDQAFDPLDKTTSDTCPGAPRAALEAWIECLCNAPNACSQACAVYCDGGSTLDSMCVNCVGFMGACDPEYNACVSQ